MPARLALGAVLLATLLVEGAFLSETRAFPDFVQPLPGLDIHLHWEAARQLRAGGVQALNIEAAMLSSPLPMFWLAATQELLGENLWRHRILYCLLGAVAVGVLFSLSRLMTNSTLGGVAAATLLTLQPTFVYSSSLPLKTTLGIALFAGALLFTLLACEAATPTAAARRATMAAALFLAATLNQWAALGPWLVVLASVAARRRPKPGGRVAPLLPLLAALLLLPPVHAAWGELSAPSGARWCWPQWGIHMFIGAQPGATGFYQPVPGLQPSPRGHTLEARLMAERRLGRPTSPAEADAFFHAETRAVLAADPWRALRLAGHKLHLFFNAFEPKENFFVEELRQRSAVLRRLPESWGWLVMLAAAGAAALAQRRQWAQLGFLLGLLSTTVVATLLTFVTARYRFAAVVPLALLAAHAVVAAADVTRRLLHARRQDFVRIVPPAGLMLLAGAFGAWAAFGEVISPADRAAMLQRARINVRASEWAISSQERLAALHNQGGQSVATRHQEIRLLRALARHSQAFALARKTLQEHPDDLEAAAVVIEYLILLGSYDEAAGLFFRLERDAVATPAALAPVFSPDVRRAFVDHVAPAVAGAPPEETKEPR